MIEVNNSGNNLIITDSSKNKVMLNTDSLGVTLDSFDVSYPWEYEKSWTLLEVKEYEEKLFYNFLIEWKHIIIITSDSFELKEEILTFFWDVDILIIIGSKESAKIFENIEARVVIPYWDSKDIFLSTLGQHIEEEEIFKLKWEFAIDATEFVNLK